MEKKNNITNQMLQDFIAYFFLNNYMFSKSEPI